MPSFDPRAHKLPYHATIAPRTQAGSGARVAIVTVPGRDFQEALTIREIVRNTLVPVPRHIDTRGARYASFWWMQPRREDVLRAWRFA